MLLHSRISNSQSKPIEHPEPVKFLLSLAESGADKPYLITAAGEAIYTYDAEEFSQGEGEATLLGVLDVHSHDVTALGVWFKKPDDIQNSAGLETRIVSGSLDGTLRQWKLGGNVSSLTRYRLLTFVVRACLSSKNSDRRRSAETARHLNNRRREGARGAFGQRLADDGG